MKSLRLILKILKAILEVLEAEVERKDRRYYDYMEERSDEDYFLRNRDNS